MSLLTGPEVCRRLHMDRQELRERSRGENGRKPDALLAECFKPGCSRPYWHASSIDAWEAARVLPKRAEAGAARSRVAS